MLAERIKLITIAYGYSTEEVAASCEKGRIYLRLLNSVLSVQGYNKRTCEKNSLIGVIIMNSRRQEKKCCVEAKCRTEALAQEASVNRDEDRVMAVPWSMSLCNSS